MAEDSLTARNRINQRNFRARRQNYIKDLEERLRKYELEGVQATIEIQAAARQVTEQNARLRNLLVTRFGMSDPDIDLYLGTTNQVSPPLILTTPSLASFTTKSCDGVGSSNFQSISPYSEHLFVKDVKPSVLSPALGLASLHKLPEQLLSCADLLPPAKKRKWNASPDTSALNLPTPDLPSLCSSGSHDSPILEHEQDTLSESSNPQTPGEFLDPVLRHGELHGNQSLNFSHRAASYTSLHTVLSSDEFPSKKSPSQHLTQIHLPKSNPSILDDTNSTSSQPHDETSCEDAARIIASMRGSNNDEGQPAKILLELGCRTSEIETMSSMSRDRCKVPNMHIFQLMDGADA